MDQAEEILYRWREPSPPQVGQVLGISGQHVKDLCRELDLPMRNKGAPNAARPTWTIPRETFRELRKHLTGCADSA